MVIAITAQERASRLPFIPVLPGTLVPLGFTFVRTNIRPRKGSIWRERDHSDMWNLAQSQKEKRALRPAKSLLFEGEFKINARIGAPPSMQL
jgi:hypothetical protein